jgi:hypothetical protein
MGPAALERRLHETAAQITDVADGSSELRRSSHDGAAPHG